MKKTLSIKNALSRVVCLVLIAALALTMAACGNADKQNESSTPVMGSELSLGTVSEIGEGKTEFSFTVEDLDGNKTEFAVKTDKTTVGEALLELELISGEQGDYGLYVKTVNGKTLDYATDGAYWSFYIDGEYASTGVDQTDITEGAAYMFKAEKA